MRLPGTEGLRASGCCLLQSHIAKTKDTLLRCWLPSELIHNSSHARADPAWKSCAHIHPRPYLFIHTVPYSTARHARVVHTRLVTAWHCGFSSQSACLLTSTPPRPAVGWASAALVTGQTQNDRSYCP